MRTEKLLVDQRRQQMPSASFTYRLKPGVTPAAYEAWIVSFDYPHVEQIASIISQRIYHIEASVFGGANPNYDYLEVIEFTNRDDYLHDLQNHPAAKAISQEMPNYVEMVTNNFARFIPPGVSR
jgi:REDY-like protein HapK